MNGPDRGHLGRRITLAQRRVLLQRIRDEVAGVVEDITATAASLNAIYGTERTATPTERATMRLIEDEQRRHQLELTRLYAEYQSLAFRSPKASSRLLDPAA